MTYFSHESACIDDGAVIGDGTKIWHFSHICSNAKIGENCILGQNTFVGSRAIIGNCVKVQNNVSIYDSVELENQVFCGPGVVFTNVNNPRAFIERKDEYKPTLIKEGASLGANSTIRCGVTVGAFVFVGAGSVILEDVPDFAMIVGNPGRQIAWISKSGEKLNLPLTGSAEHLCPLTGETYILENNKVVVRSQSE